MNELHLNHRSLQRVDTYVSRATVHVLWAVAATTRWKTRTFREPGSTRTQQRDQKEYVVPTASLAELKLVLSNTALTDIDIALMSSPGPAALSIFFHFSHAPGRS